VTKLRGGERHAKFFSTSDSHSAILGSVQNAAHDLGEKGGGDLAKMIFRALVPISLIVILLSQLNPVKVNQTKFF
jgi:hypothetical protein